MLIGYARVSKGDDQSSAAQKRALKGAGCDRLFEEAASGAIVAKAAKGRIGAMASATAPPTSVRERSFMARRGQRGALTRRRNGRRLRIGRRLRVRGLWQLWRRSRRFVAAESIWRRHIGARGASIQREREARDRKGETPSANHGPSFVTRDRRQSS